VGDHVIVPFGKSNATGVVLTITDKDPSKNYKEIIGLSEEKSPLNPDIIDLIKWFYPHYQCSPYQAYQTIVGSKKKRKLPEPPTSTDIQEPGYTLTAEQQSAVSTILTSPLKESLLFGITSSGKTEVYIQAATHILSQKKSAIILVPEIALTPQFMSIFESRFGKTIGILHSGLTPKARETTWAQIEAGHITLVIGPRSAVFAPVQNLGLIIIDEEHESTYKQETHPRYDTLVVAKKRCQISDARIVYGSATPSIEEYHHAINNHFNLLNLTKRAQERPLPRVHIIDMAQEQTTTTLSVSLEKAIQDRLAQKQKVLILINRRGFAPYISCQKCGKIHTCPECNLSLTYHTDKHFRCHRCLITQPLTHTCKHCKKNSLNFGGIGIQKIESDLKKNFPEAHITRLDRDSAKSAKDIERILTEFKSQGDILLGTQMIAKGHHIEEVTLVGVLGIDMTLNMPEFRAPERTFQLLTQVAGRAGRGEIPGEVYIQTYQPDHYAIKHASTHNYLSFYEEEITYRKMLGYPPFSNLVHIILSSKNLSELKKEAQKIKYYLQENLPKTSRFSDPSPAPIEKIKLNYRWNILIKIPHEDTESALNALQKMPHPEKIVRVILDIDPKSIL
jgi:primosomal protein N' (replication factor Y)